jgi:large subunit ribosomal protein L6
MSRVGRKVIVVPPGVKVSVSERALEVQGPSDERQLRAFHGMARALAQNAITGVTVGFSKDLDIVGVGYRAQLEGNKVVFALGYSHPVEFPVPDGIKIAIEKQTRVTVSGIDRQKVGQVAAEIRALRRPDPYKQKGIRYVGELLKKKAGKAGATGAK